MQNKDNMAPYYGQDKLSPERMQTEPEMETRMLPCMVYPEVFYRLQPYIMMVCDNAEANGITMPTQEMIETITDNIYEDIVRSNPDIAEYVRSQEQQERSGTYDRQTSLAVQGPWFRPRVRRRGLFRDLIDILLLTEFSRRRRRRFSPYYF